MAEVTIGLIMRLLINDIINNGHRFNLTQNPLNFQKYLEEKSFLKYLWILHGSILVFI